MEDKILSPQNRKSYIYIIYFEDRYFYYGVRLCPKGITPWEDDYTGSPTTHKDKWKTTSYKKFILKVYDDWKLAQEEEKKIIRPHLNNPLCLNENVGGKISLEISKEAGKKGGKIGGKINIESGHIQALGKKWGKIAVESGQIYEIITKEGCIKGGQTGGKIVGNKNKESGHIQELGKIQGKRNVESGFLRSIAHLGGKIAGKKNVETGHIYTIATKESCSKGGKIGGKKNLESGHLSRIGRKSAKLLNSQKWMCLVTGFISTPSGLSKYQVNRGIDPNLRERIK